MPNSKDFIAYVLELLRPAAVTTAGAGATARAMFGGHGIYVGGRMVALVADDTLYMKTDTETRDRFIAERLTPFTYVGHDGESRATSYYRVPDEAMENADAMSAWVRLGVAASMRAATKATRPKSTAPRSRRKPRATR